MPDTYNNLHLGGAERSFIDHLVAVAMHGKDLDAERAAEYAGMDATDFVRMCTFIRVKLTEADKVAKAKGV